MWVNFHQLKFRFASNVAMQKVHGKIWDLLLVNEVGLVGIGEDPSTTGLMGFGLGYMLIYTSTLDIDFD